MVPPPRSATAGPEAVTLRSPVEIVAASGGDTRPAQDRLRRAMVQHGLEMGTGGTRITLAARPARGVASRDESHRLRVTPARIEIVAASRAGWRHGAVSLAQWLRLHHDPKPTGVDESKALTVPALDLEDAPDFTHRGVVLDISRDKVPTRETLFGLVERLADWKINQLQLYMEHTFAYPGHEEVWRHASPWTPTEIRALDDHCHAHCIELVPNQNSFGHFHRWLVHERYRPLAECPDGVDHPFSLRREPFSLCATDPRSLELLGDLYDHLLPCFRSRQLNVGLDETLDLGHGRSASACEARGKDTVYLDFVQAVHGLAAARGHVIQMWGDIVLQHPDRIGALPEDVVALDWGYEAGHPFGEEARHFRASGRRFHVCPGTSSWLSFGGRVSNAVGNLASAARHGLASGASGYQITDWGDQGHWQPLPVSLPGLLVGAALAWKAGAWGLGATMEGQHWEGRLGAAPEVLGTIPLAQLLDIHAFDAPVGDMGATTGMTADPDGPGAATVALGELYRTTGTPSRNGSALFYLSMAPGDDLEHVRYKGLHADGLDEAVSRAADIKRRLARRSASPAVRRELAWVADLLGLGAHVGLARLDAGGSTPIDHLPATVRRALLDALEAVRAEHAPVWGLRNRSGGQEDSLARTAPLKALLR